MSNYIGIIVAVVLAFLILRTVGRIMFKVIGLFILMGLATFFLLFWNGGILKSSETQLTALDLRAQYCDESGDAIKCECIVEPLYAEIEAKYSPEQIEAMKDKKLQTIRVVLQALSARKTEIKACLAENDASGKWKEFVEDLGKQGLGEDLKQNLRGLLE